MELYVTEGRDKFAVIVVRKSGQTEQDIDIVLSVTDGSAIGELANDCVRKGSSNMQED